MLHNAPPLLRRVRYRYQRTSSRDSRFVSVNNNADKYTNTSETGRVFIGTTDAREQFLRDPSACPRDSTEIRPMDGSYGRFIRFQAIFLKMYL